MLRQGSDMAWAEEDEQVIVLHLPTGTYGGLVGTGRRLWLLLLETGDFDETIELLRDEFHAPEGALEADVRRIVDEWVRDGWVEHADGPHPHGVPG